MKNIHQHYTQDYLPKLIGIPYEDLDCWGLVKLYYDKMLGVNLSLDMQYTIGDKPESISRLIEIQKCNFREVDTPEKGDIIVLRLLGFAGHVGIFVGDGMLLHTNHGIGSVIEKVSKWKNRIEGYYHYDN